MTNPDRRSTVEAVVLDLDGVLTDTEHLWEEARIAYGARFGYTWRPEDTARVMGMSLPEWSGYMAEVIPSGDPAERVGEIVTAAMLGELAAGRVGLIPGAAELIEAVSTRAPLALASSAGRQVIDAFLGATGLRPFFTATVGSEEVARGKPAPDVYLEAARRLHVEPKRCLAVEDSANGIRAAAAAGMTVIAFPNPRYPPSPDAVAHAAAVWRTLPEVQRDILARLAPPIVDRTTADDAMEARQ